MTDNEIIKALECCTKWSCDECPIDHTHGCLSGLQTNALELIKRQQAEIERLKTEKDNLIKTYSECQIDFLKEFVNKLKENAGSSVAVNNGQEIYETKCYNIMAYKLDNLVKEMGC